jgi:lysophospholipase L1-like esterase
MVANGAGTYSNVSGTVTNSYAATGKTIRNIVHTGPGGTAVRLKFSNYLNPLPIAISDIHVALRSASIPIATDQSAIDTTTDHPVTFSNGSSSVTIPAQMDLESDAVQWNLPPNSDVVVSFYVTNGQLSPYVSMPANASYIVPGDNSALPSLAAIPNLVQTPGVYVLEDVEVLAPSRTQNIVAFGDSITAGYYSAIPPQTGAGPTATGTYPAVLAGLANASGSAYQWINVVNTGISGNMLTAGQSGYNPSGLSRFQHDVLDHPGVTDVIVLMGTNDLHFAPDYLDTADVTESIIQGYQTLIQIAHAQNPPIKIHGGTITPFGDDSNAETAGTYPTGYGSEAARLAVNQWIMTTPASAGGFDDVMDFSSAVAAGPNSTTPASTTQPGAIAMAAACTHEGLHPDGQGYQTMGTLAYDVLYNQSLQPTVPCNLTPLAP